MSDESQTTIPDDRLQAAEEFIRDELRIMGQAEDEGLIKRAAETVARRMVQIRTKHTP